MCSRRIALALLVAQAAALVVPPSCARCRRVRLRSEPGDAPAEAAAPVEDVPIATTEPEPAAPQLTERQKEIARLRAAEKFLEKDITSVSLLRGMAQMGNLRRSITEEMGLDNSVADTIAKAVLSGSDMRPAAGAAAADDKPSGACSSGAACAWAGGVGRGTLPRLRPGPPRDGRD